MENGYLILMMPDDNDQGNKQANKQRKYNQPTKKNASQGIYLMVIFFNRCFDVTWLPFKAESARQTNPSLNHHLFI